MSADAGSTHASTARIACILGLTRLRWTICLIRMRVTVSGARWMQHTGNSRFAVSKNRNAYGVLSSLGPAVYWTHASTR
jgi:hypothetical protein